MSFYPSEKSKGLNNLNDANITSPVNGDVLVCHDGEWENSHDELSAIENVYGSKNICPILNGSQLIEGVRWTVNADGTVTANRESASSNKSIFWLWVSSSIEKSFPFKVRLSGCPEGASASTYGIGGSHVGEIYTDAIFNANYSFNVALVIQAGYNAQNVVFKPMIMDNRIKDTTFVPYVPTNRDCMSYAVNTELGAHNLLNVTATTQTVSGVTYSIDSKKIITINTNGTLAANSELRLKELEADDGLAGGKSYIFTINEGLDNPDKVGGYVDYRGAGNTGWEVGTMVDTPFSHIEGRHYGVWITVAAGANYSNLKIYPQITAIEDTDKSFAPYAMTNMELTEVKSTSVTNNGITYHFYKVGRIVMMQIYSGTVTNNVSANGELVTIPDGYAPIDEVQSLFTNGSSARYYHSSGKFLAGASINSGAALRGTITYIAK